MRKIVYLLAFSAAFISCKNGEVKADENVEEVVVEEIQNDPKYLSFGDQISDSDVISKSQMLEKYQTMKLGDTIDIKFTSKVNSVCQSKGCWMRLEMGEEESFVKFKDYGFFMPKDIAGQEVIVEGKAFVEETSVEDLQHFAKDAGKSQEEIDAITEPQLTYAFISSGVLIPEKSEE